MGYIIYYLAILPNISIITNAVNESNPLVGSNFEKIIIN